jgi:phosphatidylglycerophosphatase A
MKLLREIFLTLGFSGKAPIAPGTAGSIVALILGVLLLTIIPPLTLFLLTIFISLIAIKQIDIYETYSGTHDDKSIVIDELAGMWFALSIAPGIMLNFEVIFTVNPISDLWIPILLSFVFFRFYDIKKPSIIGKIDKDVKGGLGVMGDDIVAGFVAGISSALLYTLYLKLFAF